MTPAALGPYLPALSDPIKQMLPALSSPIKRNEPRGLAINTKTHHEAIPANRPQNQSARGFPRYYFVEMAADA